MALLTVKEWPAHYGSGVIEEYCSDVADHVGWPRTWLDHGRLDDATFDEIVHRIEPVDR
jgi:hypothetical protein